MTRYKHLVYRDRVIIDNHVLEGKSFREIGLLLDRAPSTISREVAKNGDSLHYNPGIAHEAAANRRSVQKRSKIERNQKLKAFIMEKLRLGWGPKVIAGRWNMENGRIKISHESIYAWIYAQENKSLCLFRFLARNKKKRGLRRYQKQKPIEGKVLLSERPKEANRRTEPGHCESDLVFCQGNQSVNILTTIDRKTRFVVFIKNDSKHAHVIEQAMNKDVKERLPFGLKSVTLDNGSEFAGHKNYGCPAYFCNPHSPWQKGSIEHANGMLRRYVDFRSNIKNITQEILDAVAYHMNNIPRESLRFLTPAEAILKHFQSKKIDAKSRVKLAPPATEANVLKLFFQEKTCVALQI
jgi:transposase, IS30 family